MNIGNKHSRKNPQGVKIEWEIKSENPGADCKSILEMTMLELEIYLTKNNSKRKIIETENDKEK